MPRRSLLFVLCFSMLFTTACSTDAAEMWLPEATLNAPPDGAANIGPDPTLDVGVFDPDGDDLTVTFYGRELVYGRDAADFTVVAIPDTQYYCEQGTDQFLAQTEWIVDNMDDLNIVFATHLGDIVDNRDSVPEQWDVADEAMSVLDGFVPYGLAPGNHDMNSDGTAVYYDLTFPYTRYEGEPWFGGHYAPSNYKSNYQLISVSGFDLLFLHLEIDFPDGVMAWADDVLSAYPDRIAIVSTHYYMQSFGGRFNRPYTRPDGNSPEDLWEEVLSRHANVKLVLCGHYCETARREDENIFGGPVHQVLIDYQCRPNNGDGWLRILRFSPSSNELFMETYSPTRDDYLTSGAHQFTLPFEMTPTAPFELLSTVEGVASGSNVTYDWSGLTPGAQHEWYVTLDDGDNVVEGPVWHFWTEPEEGCFLGVLL